MRRQTLHGEGTSDADFPPVLFWLVVKKFNFGVPLDHRTDFRPRHPRLDIWVASDRLQHDMRHLLVDETLMQVGSVRKTGEGILGTHNSLPCQCQGDP